MHGHSIELIRSFLRLENKVEKALDIACGTGLSTKALLANTFDLITVSSGVHWFDIDKFLELAPFFPADEDAPRAVSYGNWIKFLQRID